MQLKSIKSKLALALVAISLIFSGCSSVSFSIPGDWDKSVSAYKLLQAVKVTEDEALWQYDGDFSDCWQEDEAGQYLIIRSDRGYITVRENNGEYSFTSTVDKESIDGDFEECIAAILPDWKNYLGTYQENVLSLDDLSETFSKVSLTADNYEDYIGFKKLETEMEFTGYSAAYKQKVQPYIYMYNTYVGQGTLLKDYSSTITLSGTVSRQVTINIYSLSGSLTSSGTDTEESGDNISFDISYSPVYVDDESLYSIHFTPYMDPLESWYLKTYSNGAQEIHQTLIDISNIDITEASGELVIWGGLKDDMISKNPDGNEYVAVRLTDGSISRISLTDENYIDQLAELALGQ